MREVHHDHPDHWSNRIPSCIQIDIGNRIREQLFLLPVNLFLEWEQHGTWLEERWFLEASAYIEIPHFDLYWNENRKSSDRL